MPDMIIYRKRLIPNENILLDRDTVLYADDKIMVTKWNTLHPRKDIDHGYSLYIPEEGYKISKFLRKDDSLYKWYCDIVEFYFEKDEGSCTTLDLLLDITINEKGEIHLLDMDELAQAHKDGLIDDELLHKSLIRANRLLMTAYSGAFKKYTDLLDSYIK
jgi:predicted RNA-binding protein associated with RNAse of E/G family